MNLQFKYVLAEILDPVHLEKIRAVSPCERCGLKEVFYVWIAVDRVTEEKIQDQLLCEHCAKLLIGVLPLTIAILVTDDMRGD